MSDEGKDYKCCPHCDEVEERTHFTFNDFRGNGVCKKCHGEGKLDDSFRRDISDFIIRAVSLNAFHDDSPREIDCPRCNGTGQCQTCGGSGRVKRKRFEEDDDIEDKDENEEEDDDDDDYDSDADDDDDDDDDDYSYNNSKSYETYESENKNVIPEPLSEEELKKQKFDQDYEIFLNEFRPQLLEKYTNEEADAIIRNLWDSLLEDLMKESNQSRSVTYLGFHAATEAKHKAQILGIELESLQMQYSVKLKLSFWAKENLLDGIDEEISKKISQKVRCEMDHELLKKYFIEY